MLPGGVRLWLPKISKLTRALGWRGWRVVGRTRPSCVWTRQALIPDTTCSCLAIFNTANEIEILHENIMKCQTLVVFMQRLQHGKRQVTH